MREGELAEFTCSDYRLVQESRLGTSACHIPRKLHIPKQHIPESPSSVGNLKRTIGGSFLHTLGSESRVCGSKDSVVLCVKLEIQSGTNPVTSDMSPKVQHEPWGYRLGHVAYFGVISAHLQPDW